MPSPLKTPRIVLKPGVRKAKAPLCLLLDAGASHTRAVIAGADGCVLGRGFAGAGNRMAVGPAAAAAQLRAAARQAMRAAHVAPRQIAAAIAGVAGLGYDDAGRPAILAALRGLVPAARLRVEPDAALALAGALGGAAGNGPRVVIISGTGSIVLGASGGGDGALVRAGGWGWLFGDEGSGQWIGRQAIAAAAQAWDGAGPPTALTAVVRRGLRLRSFTRLADAVYRPLLTPAQMGALAPGTLRAAAHGDAVARQIVATGMETLARQAIAVVAGLRRQRRAGSSAASRTAVRIATQGSIFQAGETVLAPLRRALRQQARRARVGRVMLLPPELPPLGGAFRLALELLAIAPGADALERFARTAT